MASRREISSRTCEVSDAVTSAQKRMFDLAERKHGFTLKVLSLETDIPEGTLRGWIAGNHEMPLSGYLKIASIKGFPNELLSIVMDTAGKTICDSEPDETDQDDAAIAALEYALKWVRARHPKSPSGVVIDHTEKPDLELAAENLIDRVGKVRAA